MKLIDIKNPICGLYDFITELTKNKIRKWWLWPIKYQY